MTQEDLKTVKAITTPRIELYLFETPHASYYVYSKNLLTGQQKGFKFKDYLLASYSFDYNLMELEGN